MEANLDLKKLIWDENDFDQMHWHDCKIYAMAFEGEKFELALDIDYILQWLSPTEGRANFKFWVVPSTLVFRNVWDLKISLESSLDLEMQDLLRVNPHAPRNAKHFPDSIEYDWTIETTSGEISFKSVGYKQYLRKPPVLLDTQKIDFKDRGGISFETIS